MPWGALIAAGVALAAQIISSQIQSAEEEDRADENAKRKKKAARVGYLIGEAEKYGQDMSGLRAQMANEGIELERQQHRDYADSMRAAGYANAGVQAIGLIGQGFDASSSPTKPAYTPSPVENAIGGLGANTSQLTPPGLLAPQQSSPTDYFSNQPLTGPFYNDDNPLWQRRVGFGYR